MNFKYLNPLKEIDVHRKTNNKQDDWLLLYSFCSIVAITAIIVNLCLHFTGWFSFSSANMRLMAAMIIMSYSANLYKYIKGTK